MELCFYGTRGSYPASGPEYARFGGNTSSAVVRLADRTLFLDAGTGIVRAGVVEAQTQGRIDILLTHLHMDHVQGLGFFGPLFQPGREIHIWGPPSTTRSLRKRLGRYLSPPLFPVRFGELPAQIHCHDIKRDAWELGPFRVRAQLIIHPGTTLGFRIEAEGRSLAFLPDHEPQIGSGEQLPPTEWLSGLDLARDVDLLVHDAQYTHHEYRTRVGWGHCTPELAVEYARAVGARRLILDSHEPTRRDGDLDAILSALPQDIPVQAAAEGVTYQV